MNTYSITRWSSGDWKVYDEKARKYWDWDFASAAEAQEKIDEEEEKMNENRYRVTPDAPGKCYRIFDTLSENFIPVGDGVQTYTTPDFPEAEEKCEELNSMERAEEEEEAEEAAVDTGGLKGRFGDPVPAGEPTKKVIGEYSQKEGQPWTRASDNEHLDKQHQCVLAALAGKVVCSSCGQEYHGPNGSLAVGERGPASAPAHSIQVTRYIGFDTADLTVDLDCVNCGHGGLYEFKGNPLMDAGIVPPLKDIPF